MGGYFIAKNLKSVKNEGDFILKNVIFTCIFILKNVILRGDFILKSVKRHVIPKDKHRD